MNSAELNRIKNRLEVASEGNEERISRLKVNLLTECKAKPETSIRNRTLSAIDIL
jgi:hypothetical protein